MCSHHCVRLYRKLLLIKVLFILAIVMVFFAVGSSVSTVSAGEHQPPPQDAVREVPDIEHPMKQPKMYSETARCPNCGMMINMWARTRHSFQHPEGDFTTCSIRCLADKAASSGTGPSGVQVALYTDPDKMVPAENAVYVIGSTAPGTMTMISKITFADKGSAEQFVSRYGGEVADFQGAFAAATMELQKSRMLIDQKRKKTGKIKEPAETDACAVCGMYPARFPKHHSQILAEDGSTIHFCSTRCMVNYNADPAQYVKGPVKISMAWVVLYPDNMYESAFGAYYVVGSKVDGPMGREAIPFKFRKDAEQFMHENGGKMVSFPLLTPELVAGDS